MAKAAFLDRDGVIIEDVGYLSNLANIQLLDNVVNSIKKLNDNDYKVIVVTNQSGVARGLFTLDFVTNTHNEIDNKLSQVGANIDRYFVCPHHPSYGDKTICECRKPKPGLILDAVKEFNIDINQSFLVGDKITDVDAGLSVGLRSYLITTTTDDSNKFIRVNSLSDAVEKELVLLNQIEI